MRKENISLSVHVYVLYNGIPRGSLSEYYTHTLENDNYYSLTTGIFSMSVVIHDN